MGVAERIAKDVVNGGSRVNVEAKGLKKLSAYIEEVFATVIMEELNKPIVGDYNTIVDDSYNTAIVTELTTNTQVKQQATD